MAELSEWIRPVWDCRWSHLGYRLAAVPDGQRPEALLWMCVRLRTPGRPVTEEECARCEFWEPKGAPQG